MSLGGWPPSIIKQKKWCKFNASNNYIAGTHVCLKILSNKLFFGLRCVALMVVTLLIIHLYLNDIWQGL
jgi:hypothetical protein